MKEPGDREPQILEWHGPVKVVATGEGEEKKLAFFEGRPSIIEGHDGEFQMAHPRPLTAVSGLYYILGDHMVHGQRKLLYVGLHNPESKATILERWKQHEGWLLEEWDWRLELFWAKRPAGMKWTTLGKIEGMLIASHQPIYNTAKKNSYRGMGSRYTVWNTGNFPGLLPEVSADHPWNCW